MTVGNYREKYVISLGGSLVIPNGGIDTKFLSSFNTFIRDQIKKDSKRQFFIVVGGGATARHYRDAGRDVVGHELPLDDLDWLGVHATRMNGHLLRTIFKDIAHPVMLNEYHIIRRASEPVVIGAGWKPGWSTDYCAVLTCENYSVSSMINLSNVERVYDKDPRKFDDANPIDAINWKEFRAIVGDDWTPGMHVPFDPIAAQAAEKLALTVKIVKGGDFDNLEKALYEDTFDGSLITSS